MRKVFILLGIVVLILAGAYYALSFLAVRWIQPQLQKAIGPGMTVREIGIRPTYLSVRGIRYEDPPSKQKLIEIEEVRIYPSLFSFLKGSVDIKEFLIKKPSFFFFRARRRGADRPMGACGSEGERKRDLSGERERGGEIPSHQDQPVQNSGRRDRFRRSQNRRCSGTDQIERDESESGRNPVSDCFGPGPC